MAAITIPYGDGDSRTVHVPEANLVGVLEPRPGPLVADADAAVLAALAQPLGMPPLADLAAEARRIVILVDDATRPTPTPLALHPLLRALAALGAGPERVAIVVATGTHRPTTELEKRRIVGEEVLARYEVVDHRADDLASLVDLGHTARGTPVLMNRRVVEADLRICVGLVKPHPNAGYTGGGKAILPGVCGRATVGHNHGFAFTAHPASCVGVITDNPIRADIEEMVRTKLGPCFLLNLVLDSQKRLTGVFAGDIVVAHRAAAAALDAMVRLPVPEVADVVIVGCSAPVDVSLYQGFNAILSPLRLPRPVVRRGGSLILSGSFPEGVGPRGFYELVVGGGSPAALRERIRTSPIPLSDQHAAQQWADSVEHVDIQVVCEGVDAATLEAMWVRAAPDLDTALARALARHGPAARVLVMPNAPFCIAELAEAGDGRQPPQSTVTSSLIRS